MAALGGSPIAQTNTFPATGNVGIGTSAPNAALDVVEQSNERLLMGGNANGWYAGAASIIAVNGTISGYVRFGMYASQYAFGGGGNFGIGTTTPEDTLTVDDDSLATGLSGSGLGPFATSIYGGASSDGIFLGEFGVRHAGIKWNGSSLDFINGIFLGRGFGHVDGLHFGPFIGQPCKRQRRHWHDEPSSQIGSQ